MNKGAGFTLIELLGTIAVIALLAGILLPSLSGARRAAQATVALTGCRTLGQAHVMYADEHKGCVLPSHLAPNQPRGVVDEFGNAIDPPVSQRWVYRLGSYFDYGWGGTTHVGSRRSTLERMTEMRSGPSGEFMWAYQVSVFPSFGVNRRFVGGDYRRADWIAQRVHVARLDQGFGPERLIVFASSRFNVGADSVEGYIEVDPPPRGSVFSEEDSTGSVATAFGHNHPRYSGSSVAVMMDGHAGRLTGVELLDRTRWSDAAARLGDADWEAPQ
jgi:prepilin-type N-terminal cleavage/methylation domain-containing protein